MPADPTPPRANDPQEREALAKIIDDNRWAPLEGGVVRRTPPRELADAILAAGFRRVAPEPVREERRWENLRDCDACNGTGYVPLAQPEPVRDDGSGASEVVRAARGVWRNRDQDDGGKALIRAIGYLGAVLTAYDQRNHDRAQPEPQQQGGEDAAGRG